MLFSVLHIFFVPFFLFITVEYFIRGNTDGQFVHSDLLLETNENILIVDHIFSQCYDMCIICIFQQQAVFIVRK